MSNTRVFQASDYSLCKEFMENQADSLFFQNLNYIDLLTNILQAQSQHLICFDDQDNIQGFLPLLVKDGKYGRVFNSLPFYGSHGGAIANNLAAFCSLKEAYKKIAHRADTAAITLIDNPFHDYDYQDLPCTFKDQRIGQFTPLYLTQDLMGRFHYKTRNMIRKAQRLNLKVEVDNQAWDKLFYLHKKNMQAIGGLAKPKAFFEAAQQRFKADIDYKIYVVYHQGVLISALLLFYCHKTVEYYTPVIDADYRHFQSNSIAIYTAMSEAQAQGFQYWNWGGTWQSQDAVYRFKKRWGTQEKDYHYYCQVNNSDIFNATPQDLIQSYPYFYVLPFDKLNNHVDNK